MIDNLFPDVNIQAFIGIRKLGTWQWLGGKNISTNIWHHGYPDALWSGECGALVRGSLKWKLLQTSCFYTLGYICETDESKCLCMVSVIVWLYYLRINPSANKDSPFIDFLHEWIHLTEKMTPKSQVTCQMNVNSLVIVKYHISLVCSQLSFSSFLSFNKKGVMFSVMYEEVHLVKGLKWLWHTREMDFNKPFPMLFASVSKRVLVPKLSYQSDEFDMQDNECAKKKKKKLISILKVVDPDDHSNYWYSWVTLEYLLHVM